MPRTKLKKGAIQIRFNCQERMLMLNLVQESIAKMAKDAKTNRLIKRDMTYLNAVANKLERRCPRCGQIINRHVIT